MNGARCLVAFLQEKHACCFDRDQVQFLMGDKKIYGQIVHDSYSVSLQGHATQLASFVVAVRSQTFAGYFVDIGNPHFIMERPISIDAYDFLKNFGPSLSTHQAFPHGVNVSVVQMINATSCYITTYERGCGMTQACGSAVCAYMRVLVDNHMLPADGIMQFDMLGGTMRAVYSAATEMIALQAPAVRSFVGKCTSSVAISTTK
jgi:diaminopimelate epimerase